MLADPSTMQREVLAAMPFSANTAELHPQERPAATEPRPGVVELPAPAG